MSEPEYTYVRGVGWVLRPPVNRMIVTCERNGKKFAVEQRRPKIGETYCCITDKLDLERHLSNYNWYIGINDYDGLYDSHRYKYIPDDGFVVFVKELT